ncbi:MAG: hypothetical protein NTZ16_02140 [Verrucomicrobia bacterium]|nr:hypothetical protein [Verrucomicrobiota bacterium]
MKTAFASLIVGGLFLTGCGDSSKPGTAANTFSNTVNAPTDYLGALGKAKQYSEKVIDTAAINNALNLFNEAEGRYPADLNELVAKHYLREVPKAPYGYKIIYDAAKGEVKVVKQ